jgi:hypothetical protein
VRIALYSPDSILNRPSWPIRALAEAQSVRVPHRASKCKLGITGQNGECSIYYGRYRQGLSQVRVERGSRTGLIFGIVNPRVKLRLAKYHAFWRIRTRWQQLKLHILSRIFMGKSLTHEERTSANILLQFISVMW